MTGPRIVGLCEGYGGLTMGVQSVLGGEVVAYAEVKPAAVALLADRHPGIPNLGDLTVADWTGVEADIVTAGWPCQPHSAAGKRLGEEDPRAIWPAVLDVIRTVRPALFVGENVARVATNGELRRVVRSLAAIGYVGTWRCAPASGLVGAPHQRDRLCLVAVDASLPAGDAARRVAAWRGDEAPVRPFAAEIVERLLKTPTAQLAVNGGSQHPEKRRAGGHGPTLADEVEWLLPTPSASNYGTNQGGSAGRTGPVRESLDTMARRGRFEAALLPTPARADSERTSRTYVRGNPTLAGALLPTPTVNDSRNGRNATSGRRDGSQHHDGWTLCDVAHADRWGVYAEAIARWEAVRDQPAPEPTQPSPRGGHVLAPAFVEWMMGVPKGWVTDGAPGLGDDRRGRWSASGERNAFLSLLGDGVVPQWAAAQVSDLVPVALAEVTALDAPHDRDPVGEVIVVAGLAPTMARLLHLARNARRDGLWTERTRDAFSARKPAVQRADAVREAKAAEDVATLRVIARRARDEGVWCEDVREVFTAERLRIEEKARTAA